MMFTSLGAALVSPIYIDYSEFFVNYSNILTVPYDSVINAFKTPATINSTAIRAMIGRSLIRDPIKMATWHI